ncbi:MAG TPA: DnaB-like helicase N-terminal domain-containing protein, partial [Acidimicrobiia bacterium]
MSYIPPHDLEAEVSVLAGCVSTLTVAQDAATRLTSQDFYRLAHRTVFDAVVQILSRHAVPDVAAVEARLRQDGTLDDVGGIEALLALMDSFGTATMSRHAIGTVAEMSARRTAIDRMRHAAQQLTDRQPFAEVIDGTVAALTGTVPAGAVVDAEVVQADFYSRLAGDTVPLFRSGLPDLDRHLTLPRGMLTIVTGLPGSGKSTFLDWLIWRMADRDDARPVFFSPEQGPPGRHLVGLVHTAIGHDPVGSDRHADIEASRSWWQERASWIADDRDNTASAVLAVARARAARGANLLVIDPYNNMAADQRFDRQDLYIQDLLRKVKRFARETQMAVVIVAHPRSVPTVNGTDAVFRVPTAGDISGGQEWWNHADVIATVWRNQSGDQPETYGDPGEVKIVVQKVRDTGRIGSIGM